MSSTPELLYFCVSIHVNGLVLAIVLMSVMSAGTGTHTHTHSPACHDRAEIDVLMIFNYA